MSSQNPSSPMTEKPLVVEDWPMSLEATREQLKKAQQRMERYRAALRLANVEIERRNRGIIALMTFAYQASRVTNPAALIKLALVQALETTATQVGAILLIDIDTKELRLGIHKGINAELSRILTGQQLGQGATALMPHLVAGAGALLEYHTSDDKMERRLLAASGLTSLVSLPLQLGPRLMGALLVGLQGKKTFTPAELCFLMAISQETAIALEGLNLREGLWNTASTLLGEELDDIELQSVGDAEVNLPIPAPFDLPTSPSSAAEPAEDDLEQLLAAMMEAEDEVQQQNADLQTLIMLSEVMNRTLNLAEILQCSVEQTQAILNTDAAWIYLVNETSGLDMRAHTGLSESYVRGMQRLKAGEQLEGRVVAESKAYFIASIAQDMPEHKIWVDRERLHAIAVVPITRPDQIKAGQRGSHVVGVLAIGKKDVKNHLWSPREMRLLNSIANQVALTIDNARLYTQVQEDEAGLRVGNEVLRAINDMLLEKNVFLEGFIQDDLTPAINEAIPSLQRLLAEDSEMLTEIQRQDIATVQAVINRLSSLAQEANSVSEVLNTEVERVFDDTDKETDYAGSPKPIRLGKKSEGKPQPVDDKEPDSDGLKPANLTESGDTQSKSTSVETNKDVHIRPMSFEEAVAAGLVPGHILDRETEK